MTVWSSVETDLKTAGHIIMRDSHFLISEVRWFELFILSCDLCPHLNIGCNKITGNRHLNKNISLFHKSCSSKELFNLHKLGNPEIIWKTLCLGNVN